MKWNIVQNTIPLLVQIPIWNPQTAEVVMCPYLAWPETLRFHPDSVARAMMSSVTAQAFQEQQDT